MSWYAVEVISEAIEDTKELLLPFDLGTWLRIALIVIFTGGIGFVNPFGFAPPSDFGGDYSGDDSSTIGQDISVDSNLVTGNSIDSTSFDTFIVFSVLLLIILSVLAYSFVSSVFEFIYYQSLINENVKIRKNFRKHWRNGLRYLGFKFVFGLVLIVLFFLAVLGSTFHPFVGIQALILSIPFILLAAIFSVLVHDLVLPEMIDSGEGMISSWKAVWPDIRSEWKQVLVYLFFKLAIGMAIAMFFFTVALTLLVPIVMVLGIVSLILATASEFLVIIPIFIGFLLFTMLLIGIKVVTSTFLYHYILRFFESLKG